MGRFVARTRAVRRSLRGITLIELLAASLITTIIGMAAMALLVRPARFGQQTVDRVMQAATANTGYEDLGRQLTNSYVMKSGLLQCSGNTITEARTGQADIPLAKGDRFAFAYSVHSSIVALSNPGGGEVTSTDAYKYPKNSLVMLSHINNPTFGGVFHVIDNDPATGRLSLENMDQPHLGCGPKAATSQTLNTLATDARGVMFNQSAVTYRADSIRVVRYTLDSSKQNGGGMDLMWEQWPVPLRPEDEIWNGLAAERVTGALFKFTWVGSEGRDGDGIVDAGAGSGLLYIDYSIHRRELAGGNVDRDREMKGRASFRVGGGLRINFGAPTTPDSVNAVFPTCGLSGTPVQGIFRKAATWGDPKEHLNMYRIDPLISGTGGKLATLRGKLEGSPKPVCWQSDIAENFDTAATPIEVSAPGVTYGFTAVSNNPLPLYCDMPAGSYLTGELIYYDAALSRNVNLPCAGFVSPAGALFEYRGTASSCASANGRIVFGRLFEFGSPMPGPTLYVDETSCEWDSAPGVLQSCQPDGGAGYLTIPLPRLVKVSLRPIGINISNGPLEIACD